MKKIILIIVFCMMLSSCGLMEVRTNGYATSIDSNAPNLTVDRYEYEGHTFLLFGRTTNTIRGMVHDPNCSCFKKEENK